MIYNRIPGYIKGYEIFVPPSILSFYADIPKEHKLKLTQRIPESNTTKRTVVIKGCQFATHMVTWFNCDEPPWDTTTLREFDFRETFVLVDCSDQPTHLEIRVVRNEEPIKRSVKKRKQNGMAHLNSVNIMLLELGSVSLQYADRHLPKTREQLKRYRINRNDGNEFECPCINSPADELCGIVNTSLGDICNNIKMLHHGLRLETIRPVSRMVYWCPRRDLNLLRMPWLFGCYGHKRLHNFFRRGILLRLFSVCHTMKCFSKILSRH